MISNKFQFIIASILFIILLSCNDKNNEPAGLSNYFINNQSSQALIYKGVSPIQIETSQIIMIAEDGGIGIVAPKPSEGVQVLTLYRLENGNEIVAFEQNPVIDSLWNEEKMDNQEYGLVHYTLSITDDMID